MESIFHAALNRRSVLSGAATVAAAGLLPSVAGSTPPATREFTITARPGRAPLVSDGYPETAVWAYNGTVPGPEIRVRQGDRVRINGCDRPRVKSRLPPYIWSGLTGSLTLPLPKPGRCDSYHWE